MPGGTHAWRPYHKKDIDNIEVYLLYLLFVKVCLIFLILEVFLIWPQRRSLLADVRPIVWRHCCREGKLIFAVFVGTNIRTVYRESR